MNCDVFDIDSTSKFCLYNEQLAIYSQRGGFVYVFGSYHKSMLNYMNKLNYIVAVCLHCCCCDLFVMKRIFI